MIDGAELDSHVRHVVYHLFVQTARAPSTADVAAHLSETEIDVAAAFGRLPGMAARQGTQWRPLS